MRTCAHGSPANNNNNNFKSQASTLLNVALIARMLKLYVLRET